MDNSLLRQKRPGYFIKEKMKNKKSEKRIKSMLKK